MGELVCINTTEQGDPLAEQEQVAAENNWSRALVPTIDIYSAKVLLALTQRMVEDTVDRRISQLEKKMADRDQEVMRAIRKIQGRLAVRQEKVRLPWWRRVLGLK
ncbi:MAG: hypothetical protein GX949_04670 [Peptococcaceae bacterium]|jgi:hypothetical protein|nr:hypothetical protein [Peptococcaceae bacterium]